MIQGLNRRKVVQRPLQLIKFESPFCTLVGDYIHIMKTTFDLNFDSSRAINRMAIQKYGNKEKLSIKKAYLFLLEAYNLI